nr:PREDICTED: E3 ubiquitin-protein ligase TRIM39-like [Latimeria chalumnae]|eukprot:XP_014345207.1 PREDICTED: E3 ubiquitin-protein ligase TRIM39-like [Latimeria chalumnae]
MAAQVETLGIELKCSICLELFNDPVMLDCSHNFCKTCISHVPEDWRGNLPCPHCRQTVSRTSLRPNLILANIVEKCKPKNLKAETFQWGTNSYRSEENEYYCKEHGQKLNLFCEEDQKMICLLCELSGDHRFHNIKPIHEAYEICKLKLLKKLENSTYFCISEEKSEFSKNRRIPEVLDSITINPETANYNLVVSDDRTSMHNGASLQLYFLYNSERFTKEPVALGSEGFTSGRHYWEVKVGDNQIWRLGVVRESIEKNNYVIPSLKNGHYVLEKMIDYYIHCFQRIPLSLTVKPSKIGVYLDYEGGRVSFYNADNMSYICTFTDTFTEKMYPYFYIGFSGFESSKGLKLISLNS